jgi:hypothetical protein
MLIIINDVDNDYLGRGDFDELSSKLKSNEYTITENRNRFKPESYFKNSILYDNIVPPINS